MLNRYIELVVSFREAGYEPIFFSELESPNGQLILRHDVDFDCDFAYAMAKAEKEEGIKSTYFFLLTSSNYNLLCPRGIEVVREIGDMGHKVSLHFDYSLYPNNCEEGLLKEIKLFETIMGTTVDVISLHRPPPGLEPYRHTLLAGYEHSYLDKFVKDIIYRSDSNNCWQSGNPLKSEQFEQHKSFQLLIHPLLWSTTVDDMMGKVHQLTLKKQLDMFSYVRKYCSPSKGKGKEPL